MLPQLSFQFYELGLEFNHGMCDNAGCQGCARGWAGRAGGRRIIDVLESPEHAPRNICVLRHVVNTEIVKCFKYWVVKRHCRQLLRL
jgi:hypothetical protein